KSVTLHDNEAVNNLDLSTNYYISKDDIGKNKAEACLSKLAELNNYVDVTLMTNILTFDVLKNYNVIILVDYNIDKQIEINNFTHQHNIHFISTSTKGLTGQIFCDFGNDFIINDKDGEQIQTCIINNIISEDEKTLVMCIETKPHNLTSGDFVKFQISKGMIELNNIEPQEITYVDKFSFKINVDT